LLHVVPKDETQQGKAWPSPRSWDAAADLIGAGEEIGMDDDALLGVVEGCVGAGHALEFMKWRRELDLPNPLDLLAKPSEYKITGRGDLDFAVLAAVAQAVIGRLEDKDAEKWWMAGWMIFASAAKQGAKDVAAIAVKTLAQNRKKDFPVPAKELKEFLPLLKAAGI
jgi:hypothetical protein